MTDDELKGESERKEEQTAKSDDDGSERIYDDDETATVISYSEASDIEEKNTKRVSFFALFRFARGWDFALLLFGFIGAIGHGLLVPGTAFLLGRVIDALNSENVLSEMTDLIGYFVIIGVIEACSGFLQFTCFGMTGHYQAKRIREAYLKAVLKQEMAFFDQHNSGVLTAHLTSDMVLVQDAIGLKLANVVEGISGFLANFLFGLFTSWQLTLVVCALSPLIIGGGFISIYLITTLTMKAQDVYADADSTVMESLGAIRTVASFGGESLSVSRYLERLMPAVKYGIRSGFVSGVGSGFTTFTLFVAYAIALGYGAILVHDGKYSGSTIIQAMLTITSGCYMIGNALQNIEALTKGQGAAFKLYSVIQRTSAIDPTSSAGLKPDEVKGAIEFKNIQFRYPTRPDIPVFEDFSLTIQAGQTVALVGPSGSGKSSIVGLIQRYYDVSKGVVSLDGVDIADLNLKWLRSQIGLVSQEPVLFAGTVAENIGYGKEGASLQEIEEAAKSANAHDFISQFPEGYNTFVGDKGTQLSGGQKQRIAIARALIKNPKIILLDEATSALDNQSEQVVQAALNSLMKGRTTIVVAHRLSTIKSADLIVVMERGQVKECGKHDELMQLNGLYAELVNLQGGNKEKHTEKTEVNNTKQEEEKVAEQEVEEEEEEENIEPDKIHPVSISRLLKLSKPEWLYLFFGAIGAVITGSLWQMYAVVFSRIMKIYYGPEDQIKDEALPWSFVLAGVAVACIIGNTAQSGFFGLSGERLTNRIREMAYKSVIRKNISFFDEKKNSAGLLSARLGLDATLVQGLLGTLLGFIVQNMIVIIFGCAVSFYFSWKLTLVMLSVSPLLGFCAVTDYFGYKRDKTQEMINEANRLALESIQSVRTVASFTLEERIVASYSKTLEAPLHAGLKRAKILGTLSALGELAMFIGQMVSFWYGGKLVANKEMSFYGVISVFQAISMATITLGTSVSFAPNIAGGRLAAARLFKLIDEPSPIDPFSESGRKEIIEGRVELKNVSFRYPTRKDIPILEGLDLKIKPGKVVALVGPSGCGKSTVVGLLERFYVPDKGQILIDGVPIEDFHIATLRSQISLVSQEPILFSGTVADNIRYGRQDATQDEVEAAAKASNAHDFIMQFPEQYNTTVGERGSKLSGGQKQRIAIARAIIKNPKILLLDEATSALDSESERIVQEALERVMKGRTTIIIAHRLSTIRSADKIVVIKNGHVLEKGKHEELLQLHGFYYQLVTNASHVQ